MIMMSSLQKNLIFYLKSGRTNLLPGPVNFVLSLNNLPVYPRPLQDPLPIWLGVGGTPESFVRAGTLGLPLMVAVIGGETHRFRPLIDLYKEAGAKAGHSPEKLKVGLHSLGYVANTTEEAINDFYPGYAEAMNKIGKERGWPMMTRPRFEAQLGPRDHCWLVIRKKWPKKFSGIAKRLEEFQDLLFRWMWPSTPNAKMLQSIELIGIEDISPLVNNKILS